MIKQTYFLFLLIAGATSYGVQTTADFEKTAQEIMHYEQKLRVERVQKIKELGQRYNFLQDGIDTLVEKLRSGNLPESEKAQIIAALAVLFTQQRDIIREAEQLDVLFAQARAQAQLKMTDAKEKMIRSL